MKAHLLTLMIYQHISFKGELLQNCEHFLHIHSSHSKTKEICILHENTVKRNVNIMDKYYFSLPFQ